MSDDVHRLVSHLTGREREIMELLAAGDSTKTISSRLQISPKTVDNHRAKIMDKMHVNNAAQLVHILHRIDQESPSQ